MRSVIFNAFTQVSSLNKISTFTDNNGFLRIKVPVSNQWQDCTTNRTRENIYFKFDVAKMLFTPCHVGNSCTDVVAGHRCSTMCSNNRNQLCESLQIRQEHTCSSLTLQRHGRPIKALRHRLTVSDTNSWRAGQPLQCTPPTRHLAAGLWPIQWVRGSNPTGTAPRGRGLTTGRKLAKETDIVFLSRSPQMPG
jgi:hypothetical protein